MAGRWRGTLGQTAGSPIRFRLDVVGRDEKRGGKLASLGSRQVQPVGAARKKADREAQQGKANRVAGNPVDLSSGANRKAPSASSI